MKINDYTFLKAIPVWERGTGKVMDRAIRVCAKVTGGEQTEINIAASTSFLMFANGKVAVHGPARAAHGFYRVDTYDITGLLTDGENDIELRVVGYNINAFSYINQPSFVCAEIVRAGNVIAYTDAESGGFTAYGYDEKIMKTQRYSFQRTFAEAYNLDSGRESREIELERTEDKHFICRDMPAGDYERIIPSGVFERGTVTYSDKQNYYNSREISAISGKLLGYHLSELEFASHIEVGKMDFSAPEAVSEGAGCIELSADTYADIDMVRNYTGLFELELEAHGDGELYLLYDEVMPGGELNCFRLGTSNIVAIKAKAGKYTFVSAEPYDMRYVRIVAKGCTFTVRGLDLVHIAFPMSHITAKFVSDDEVMKKIYDAALETFRANVVDIYMDCPSRERAGWLCDSFFTSRVEKMLTGKSDVERAFLENFLLPPSFECLPEGMLPMCYPSDHYDGVFIPNWAMWYGVELDEYEKRTGDRALIDAAKDRMYVLLAYFKKFENEFGLLEGLKSWVFVEWSKSNELVQDVSFASNMLYAKFMSSIAALYGDAKLEAEAEKLRHKIDEMCMTDSGFYCDNALRRDGKLVLSGECTESCQYYAFFCGVATPESRPWLWETMIKDFGYDRQKTGKYPEIYPANAFIGNYLRLDLIAQFGSHEVLYDNIRGYFTYMADKTGTLWENTGDYASCNHGFASHVIYWMQLLGLVK